MRLAVLIIALCLTIIVGLQSCAVMAGGGVLKDQGFAAGGAIGLLVASLFILGAAFVMNMPRVSMGMFIAAGLFGFIGASAFKFADLTVWAVVSLILALMSWFGAKELRKKALQAGEAK